MKFECDLTYRTHAINHCATIRILPFLPWNQQINNHMKIVIQLETLQVAATKQEQWLMAQGDSKKYDNFTLMVF